MATRLIQQLVLASASPRRRDLLLQLQPSLHLQIRPASLDEQLLQGEAGEEAVQRLALAKAHRVISELPAELQAWPVLAADTEVLLEGQPLGKPESPEAAVERLKRLSGSTHEVKTALVLVQETNWQQAVVTTQVSFRRLSLDEIYAYVATGEPFDKAGGYAIQGRGASLVERIAGSYSNVVGLPLEKLTTLFYGLGYQVF